MSFQRDKSISRKEIYSIIHVYSLTLASVSDCGMNISLSRTIRCCHKNDQVIFKQDQMVNQVEKVSAHLPVKKKKYQPIASDYGMNIIRCKVV